jgi:hypothetical protein
LAAALSESAVHELFVGSRTTLAEELKDILGKI